MVPAEGLLGADAPRPFGAAVEDAGVQLRLAAKLSNPLVCLSGVRISIVKLRKPGEVVRNSLRRFAG
jgi:hypothetical protein